MKLIVAADNKWGIGYNNKLLISIPGDLKRFKELTTGHVVVLGRKTLETFPKQKPLPNRTNIILSRDKNYKVEGAVVVNSIDELKEELKKYNTDDVFIIGGDSIYKQMIDMCDTALVTRIDHTYAADAFFPNLDASDEWEITETDEEQSCFDITYEFVTYKRVK